jgi:threonine/homoserine/homoserine lactone efflux protein
MVSAALVAMITRAAVVTPAWAVASAAAGGAAAPGEAHAATVFSPVLAALGVGAALASAPGPVQAVLLTESVRGGVGRGLRALAGAGLTFGVLLVSGALGLSAAAPHGNVLAVLQMIGGAFLLWLSADGFRSPRELRGGAAGRFDVPPIVRGAVAVLLNPGAWLFLAAVAAPLFASAHQHGGAGSALVVAVVMMAGLAAGDGTVVLLGGLGLRRAEGRARQWIRWALALVLAGIGAWLLVTGATSLLGI